MLMHKFKHRLINSKNIYKLLAFFIPIIIVVMAVFISHIKDGISIYHSENFLIADMQRQYVAIFSHLWDSFRGNSFLFYTFNNGLGGNMASTIGYYASSPLNIFYILGSKTDIPLITCLLYLFKIGLMGLFMNIFLNYKFGRKYTNIIFSTMYALSAYAINYYFHIMWLDVVALAPLVMLGINKIIDEKNIKLYTISLAIAIISNFYIAYMLCIFCVIYLIYELFLTNSKNKMSIIRKFIFSSLIAAGISCFILLPTVYNLKSIYRQPSDSLLLSIKNYNIFKYYLFRNLGRIYIGSYNRKIIMEEYSSIYAGMFTFILLFFYFINKNIKLKERICSLIVLLFMIISMIVPLLFWLWHGGSMPNCYPNRFSFLFIFFSIYLATKSFQNIKNINIYKCLFFFLFFLLITFLTSHSLNDYRGVKPFNSFNIILSYIFVLIYFIIFILMSKQYKYNKILTCLFALFAFVEIIINSSIGIVTRQEWKTDGDYVKFYKNYCKKINNLDSNFYRIASQYNYGDIDAMICNNQNIEVALSTNNKNTYKFWKDNGGHISYLKVLYDYNKTPIIDSLLGVKYVVSENSFKDSYYHKTSQKYTFNRFNSNNRRSKKKDYYVYENPYALSLGYLIPNNYQEIYKKEKVKDSIDSINRLMRTLSGNPEDVLTKYPRLYVNNVDLSSNYIFDINDNNPYLYFNFSYETHNFLYSTKTVKYMYINGKKVTDVTNGNLTAIKIKNKYANKKIMVKLIDDLFTQASINNLNIYKFNQDVFEKDIKEISKRQLTKVEIYKNKVSGEIDVHKDSVLFTSIPYEDGWKVYVDGKKVKYEKISDEFIGIKLKKGHHKIKMIYYPPLLLCGIIVSGLSIITLIIYEKLTQKWRYKNDKKK